MVEVRADKAKSLRYGVLTIANGLSLARLGSVFTLLVVEPLSAAFCVIYVFCGVSDVLDGYVARKTNTVTTLGQQLDSIADFALLLVVAFVLLPIINLPGAIYLWLGFIVVLRLLSVAIVYAKYSVIGICHTYANKLTGLLLFLSPLFIERLPLGLLAEVLCIVATLSALEEVVIHASSKQLDLDLKSVFLMKTLRR